MKLFLKREEGQSILIVAGALVVLVALMGLVADAGNAYVQRRQMQNAMDSGAQAGALAFAQNKLNGEIANAITKFVKNNRVDPAKVKAYYVVQGANGNNIVVRTLTIDQYGSNNAAPQTLSVGGSDLPVVGVQVEGDKTFDTFFAGVVGWRTMQVNGGAAAYANKGSCSGDGLFPVAFSANTFVDENGDGIPDVHYEQTDPTYTYLIWEKKLTAPGNFGWLTWNPSDTSETTLVANMNDPRRSGPWRVGDSIPGATGTMASSSVQAALQHYIDTGNQVTLPVYDYTTGSGSNVTYHIKAFARFRITAQNWQGNDKDIEGKFEQWVDPNGEGGCANYGVASVRVRPPIDTKRALLGVVKLNKITPVTGITQQQVHVPIDVVNVLDISGSMTGSFGSQDKLTAAKQALTNFNNNMQPSQGDRVALVTFPTMQNSSRYNFSCTQNGNTYTYYFGQVRSSLTSNVAGVNSTINSLEANGGTPLADGIRLGRQTVLDPNYHQSSHPAIMIVASDGIANIRTTGKWTGFSGSTYSNPTCNQPAVQDAIDQANIAKSDGNLDALPDVTVFSIAVGSDFNADSLRAIATIDTDPSKPHYFRATDAGSMASIYSQIASRVQTIQNESCTVVQSEAFAGGASVAIRNQSTGQTYNLTTTSTGEYILPDAPPGTYVFQSATVTVNGFTYNVFTDGVGGPALAQNPTVDVGMGSGTYKADLALATSTTITCH